MRILGGGTIIISTLGGKKKSVYREEVENRRVALCQVFEVMEGHSEDTIDDLEAVIKVRGTRFFPRERIIHT